MANSTGTRETLAPVPPRESRLGWLDALRAVAALVVVYEHALNPLYPELRAVTGPWFDAGIYGVMVFFLVSGYVIPASLERRGSVAGFWVEPVLPALPAVGGGRGGGPAAGRLRRRPDARLAHRPVGISGARTSDHAAGPAQRAERAQRALDPLVRDGLLPPGHRPVRGRGAPAQRGGRLRVRGRGRAAGRGAAVGAAVARGRGDARHRARRDRAGGVRAGGGC
ncbi:acyltransferase family protein [Nonomuraea ferruginea]